ncbi:biotin-independent malonate decarboxylase subunit beta [Salinisphaera sp. LB1]|uniref:biotin-independent malonate decarboxylase subunit beta n=1 Tax=Salinisphaera sp. LB1 TaxID=2183911 RepID=UPI000D706073|nr:biotin-independent malonate decarboxylase subunit beta [Salinisphaera sp. LB1]AWN16677.1 Malonate decarboxylase beta subunit [Salinisphaera sp. LB1]
MNTAELLARESFVELPARARVECLLDAGTMRELVGPFERQTSPWLPKQDIVTQADDGVIIARGTIDGVDVVVAAIEPAFQGGSMGEVGGAKIAGALELAAEDAAAGKPVVPVLLLETGGVRLQEANCGLAAIAEIHAAIVALRALVPVIGVITGPVGCFGGMSIAAGLCSHLIVTREARLGLNGPQVIEQEAGVEEFDSRDRPMIWSLLGGAQRAATGLADERTDDDRARIRARIAAAVAAGPTRLARTADVAAWDRLLEAIDPAERAEAGVVREVFARHLGGRHE